MLSIDYYHKLKELYRNEVSKSRYIYIYTKDGIVEKVMFSYRQNNKYKFISEIPHEKLLLSRDKQLPKNVMVQVRFSPLSFELFEG